MLIGYVRLHLLLVSLLFTSLLWSQRFVEALERGEEVEASSLALSLRRRDEDEDPAPPSQRVGVGKRSVAFYINL